MTFKSQLFDVAVLVAVPGEAREVPDVGVFVEAIHLEGHIPGTIEAITNPVEGEYSWAWNGDGSLALSCGDRDILAILTFADNSPMDILRTAETIAVIAVWPQAPEKEPMVFPIEVKNPQHLDVSEDSFLGRLSA